MADLLQTLTSQHNPLHEKLSQITSTFHSLEASLLIPKTSAEEQTFDD